MTNGLVNAIQDQVDPFYRFETFSTKTNTIYCFQFPLWIEAFDIGIRPCSLYIGETDTIRGWIDEDTLKRWTDGDYSKCPEKPKLLSSWEVHKDLKDGEIRNYMRKIGWSRKNPYGGSPEMRVKETATSYSHELHLINELVKKRDAYYKDYELRNGISPYVTKKKANNREDEMYRIPDSRLIFDICDKLKDLSKDAKVYVPLDAHGHFCDYLASMGFTEIYTDKDYEYFPSSEYLSNPDSINLITQDQYNTMKFDVVIGNPPYGTAGKLAIKFLNGAGDRVKEDGTILLVLPKSVRKDSSLNKIRNDLHCVHDEECDKNDFPNNIDAVVQQWEVRDEVRSKIFIHRKHPDFQFLKYEDRFDADVFVGEYGDGPSGKVLTNNFTHYAKGHHFIKAKPEIVERFVELGNKNTFRENNNTNGRRHCCKHDLITIYIKHYGTGQQK